MMAENIKRIDLSRDYMLHREEYLEAIEAVCNETAFSGGKFADKFDSEFAAFVGSKYAAGVNNGTSALHLAGNFGLFTNKKGINRGGRALARRMARRGGFASRPQTRKGL